MTEVGTHDNPRTMGQFIKPRVHDLLVDSSWLALQLCTSLEAGQNYQNAKSNGECSLSLGASAL